MKDSFFGGIEAGGTKFVCAVGRAPDHILGELRFPTTSVEATLGKTIAFLREQQKLHGALQAIGIAAFGPLDIDPSSPSYGHITSTPKAGWKDADILGPIRQAFQLPIGFDTDVNGAALGEHRWGAARDLDNFIYLTIGTGIGGGGMLRGMLLHGMLHPEMGHVRLPHDWEADPFPGVCPYHGDCFEGLATGPAIAARWGQSAETLPPEHPAWELEANYLALAVANLVFTLSPQRIILGGGVMKQSSLFQTIRSKVQGLLNGYVHAPQILEKIEDYIVPPHLGWRAGVLGAIALAEYSL